MTGGGLPRVYMCVFSVFSSHQFKAWAMLEVLSMAPHAKEELFFLFRERRRSLTKFAAALQLI